MTGQPHTDADVRTVCRAIMDTPSALVHEIAAAVLDALAADGRLSPEPTAVTVSAVPVGGPQLASAARVVLDAIRHHPQPGVDLSEAANLLGAALDDHDRRHPLLPAPKRRATT